MEDIKQMRKRHAREIAELQASCHHIKSTRTPSKWFPGHFSGNDLVCDNCGKVHPREVKNE